MVVASQTMVGLKCILLVTMDVLAGSYVGTIHRSNVVVPLLKSLNDYCGTCLLCFVSYL